MTINLNNPEYKFWALVALCLCVVLLFRFKGCEPKPIKLIEVKKITQDLKKADSIQQIVIKMDSVRFIEVVKWRYLKTNPERLPCDSLYTEVVSLCDTIILHDSLEINEYKALVRQDSIIIKDYQTLVRNDSMVITGLNKEIRKQKTQKRLIIAGFVLFESARVIAPLIK